MVEVPDRADELALGDLDDNPRSPGREDVARREEGLVGQLLGGWKIAATFRYARGTPFSVVDSATDDIDWDGFQEDRPIVLDPGVLGAVVDDPGTGVGTVSECDEENNRHDSGYWLNLRPAVNALERLRVPRFGGATLVMAALLGIVGASAYALHDELDFWVVPLNMLVAGSFLFVNELGRVLEEPFTLFWNGLPLMALSRTIEANARACLGDRDFPPIPAPDHNGVLM